MTRSQLSKIKCITSRHETVIKLANDVSSQKTIRVTRSISKALEFFGICITRQSSKQPAKVTRRRHTVHTVGVPPRRRTERLRSLPLIHSEAVWCICRKPDDGLTMIYCDEKRRQVKWFHLACLSITDIPAGKWFCPNCQFLQNWTKMNMLFNHFYHFLSLAILQ